MVVPVVPGGAWYVVSPQVCVRYNVLCFVFTNDNRHEICEIVYVAPVECSLGVTPDDNLKARI